MTRRSHNRALGFTLVELLLSIVIAVLVVVLLSSIFSTASRTVAGQAQREQGAPAAMTTIERLRDDLARAILPDQDGGCLLVLKDDPLSFAFCTLRPSPTDGDLRWSGIWHVEFRTEPDVEGALRLVCVEHPSVGPGSAETTTNIVIGGIDRFGVELFDGADWYTTWPPGEEPAKPKAARVQLVAGRFKGQQEWTSEILIPAGMVVTSSVLRAAPAR